LQQFNQRRQQGKIIPCFCAARKIKNFSRKRDFFVGCFSKYALLVSPKFCYQ